MIEDYNFFYKLFKSLGFNEVASEYSNIFVYLLIILILAYLLDRIFKKVLTLLLTKIALRTKSKFDDLLSRNNTAKYLAHFIPLLFIYKMVFKVIRNIKETKLIKEDVAYWENVFNKSVKIYIIILGLLVVRSILSSLKDYLKTKPKFHDKPLDSYIQVIMIGLWGFGIFSFISVLFEIKETTFIATLGSISAIIILIFRDTILGFVASISVTVNDMVRIGDWITMDKFGTDGDVIEINLATVKVRNFDNTTTTIPTYSLISDSFRNWRGMKNSDGRRIKRHIRIRQSSVKFLSKGDIDHLKSIDLINQYLTDKLSEINKNTPHPPHNDNQPTKINNLNLTNLGVFRKYIINYIKTHSAINKEMTLMVRQLQPDQHGIPLEVYCFSKDKIWENYEYIMADIFDHILAAISYFDLETFELDFLKNQTPN